MFNPNSNEQMMESVSADLTFLGFIVADVTERTDWCQFTVGNESITFATVTFIDGRCNVRGWFGNKTTKVSYKGSQEQMSQDVIAKVVKLGLARYHSLTK